MTRRLLWSLALLVAAASAVAAQPRREPPRNCVQYLDLAHVSYQALRMSAKTATPIDWRLWLQADEAVVAYLQCERAR